MVNMDKWKTPLLIIVAIIAVAFIGNQMGLFYVAGGADYSMRSLDQTSYTASVGDTITVSGKGYINNIQSTTQTYIVKVEPNTFGAFGTTIYTKTVAPGYNYRWSFSGSYPVTKLGTFKVRVYRCSDSSCSSKSFAPAAETLYITIASTGGDVFGPPTPDTGTGGDTGTTPTPKPQEGCEGTTYVTYDLFGTSWVPSLQYNSASCGYTPPNTNPPPTPDIPQQPADRCDGTTKITYSLSGTTWVPASQFNSVDCGYVAPGTGGGTTPPPGDKPVDTVVIIVGSIIVLGGLGAIFMKMKK